MKSIDHTKSSIIN